MITVPVQIYSDVTEVSTWIHMFHACLFLCILKTINHIELKRLQTKENKVPSIICLYVQYKASVNKQRQVSL